MIAMVSTPSPSPCPCPSALSPLLGAGDTILKYHPSKNTGEEERERGKESVSERESKAMRRGEIISSAAEGTGVVLCPWYTLGKYRDQLNK